MAGSKKKEARRGDSTRKEAVPHTSKQARGSQVQERAEASRCGGGPIALLGHGQGGSANCFRLQTLLTLCASSTESPLHLAHGMRQLDKYVSRTRWPKHFHLY